MKWIPSITLPEKNGHYLVVLKRDGDVDGMEIHDRNVKILRFHDGWWRLPVHIPEWINETLTQEVTHWMELPELPEEPREESNGNQC